MSSVGLLVGRVRLAVSPVGRASSCLARGWLLVNREHRLVVVCESLVQHADLVDGFGRWRLRLSGGCLVLSRAKSASSSSAASPSSLAVAGLVPGRRRPVAAPCGSPLVVVGLKFFHQDLELGLTVKR